MANLNTVQPNDGTGSTNDSHRTVGGVTSAGVPKPFLVGSDGSQQVTGGSLTRSNSTAWENSRVLKNSSGRMMSLWISMKSTSTKYLMIFDLAAVPSNGAVTPVWAQTLQAGYIGGFDFGGGGLSFSNGIVVLVSTTNAPTLTIDTSSESWFLAGVL